MMNASPRFAHATNRKDRGPGLVVLALLFCISAVCCVGLSEEQKTALDLYKQNSKAYMNAGKYYEAIAECTKGLDLDDDDESLNLTLAWALLRTGTKANVFQSYEQFHKTDDLRWFGHDFRVTLGLGETCYQIAVLYRKRLTFFEKKVAADPAAAKLYKTEMEECRKGLEEYLAKAVDYLEDAIADERHKDNVEALLTLGQVYAYSRKYEKAVPYLTRGLELLSRSRTFQERNLEKGSALTADGRRYFQREVRRNKRWEKDLRGVLAFVYRKLGRPEDALEQYDLLEKSGLFDGVQYYNRAQMLQALGQYKKAADDYERFLRTASLSGKKFDEDEHFHLAIENREKCLQLMKEGGSSGATPAKGAAGEGNL